LIKSDRKDTYNVTKGLSNISSSFELSSNQIFLKKSIIVTVSTKKYEAD